MGTYSAQEYLDTFGGLPEPGEAYSDPDDLRDAARDAENDAHPRNTMGCCDGTGRVHHVNEAGSFGTDCDDPVCVAWREARWAWECGERPDPGPHPYAQTAAPDEKDPS